ncbi:MAG: hypothetical protein QM680_10485 [Luteolibacter sp.]
MALIGWHLGTPEEKSRTAAAQPAASGRSPLPRTKSARIIGDEAAAERMRAIRNTKSMEERLRATISLVYALPVSDFPAWAEGDRFNLRDGPELHMFRMALFDRWEKESPETLIPWALENNYGQAGRALKSLAKNSPQTLLGHFQDHPDPKAEVGILAEIAKNHPDLALERLRTLAGDAALLGESRSLDNLLAEIAKQSPSALQSGLENLPPALQEKIEIALCGQRLAGSFVSELHALADRADGWKIFSSNLALHGELGAQILENLRNVPPSWLAGISNNPSLLFTKENTRNWLAADLEGAGFSKKQAARIYESALYRMYEEDPRFALARLQEMDFDPGTKNDLISRIMITAKGDGAKAEALIGMLDTEEEKQLARQQWEISNQPKLNAFSKPGEWMDALSSSTKTPADGYYALVSRLSTLDSQALGQLAADFRQLPADRQQNVARNILAGFSAYEKVDPAFIGEVLRTYISNPLPADENSSRLDPVRIGASYAVKLAVDDPVAATNWVSSLPEGDAKLWAYKNVASNWRQYDPQAVDSWVQTLPPAVKSQVSGYLAEKK